MEELILVTGCDLTRSWTHVAFLGGQVDARVSFGVNVEGPDPSDPRINFQFSPENVRGAVLCLGPEGAVRLYSVWNSPHISRQLWHDLCSIEPARESMCVHPRVSCRSFLRDIAKAS